MGLQQKFINILSKKLLLLVIIFGFSAACIQRTGEESQPIKVDRQRVEDAKQAVFHVAARTCQEPSNKTAVAFAIDEHTLLSVAHTFEETDVVTIQDATGKRYAPSTIMIDKEKDLALITISETTQHFLEIAEPKEADEISLVTYVEDDPASKSAELLQIATVTIDGEQEKQALEIKASITSGDSGSPVINQQGQLVGMIFATSKSEEIGWALSSIEISESLLTKPPATTLRCETTPLD